MTKKTILITGIGGYFGKMLLPYLEDDPEIERIIGIDQYPLSEDRDTSKLDFIQADIRDSIDDALLREANVLVHLAFILMRLPHHNGIDAINIDATQKLLLAAGRLKIPKIVITSSVMSYGLHPDNPVPLTEESPLRPNDGLYYSRAKAINEAFLDKFAIENPDISITRLRPCTVIGPNADPEQMAQMVAETVPLVKGYDPLYQFLHEDDMAQALHLAIKNDLPGVFNVTSDEPRTLRSLVESRGGKVLPLPRFIVRSLLAILWRMKASVFAPEWIDLSCYPIVASNTKLKTQGWSPDYTTPEAYLSLLRKPAV
jgi:UDP-glucose 4-epimerase